MIDFIIGIEGLLQSIVAKGSVIPSILYQFVNVGVVAVGDAQTSKPCIV